MYLIIIVNGARHVFVQCCHCHSGGRGWTQYCKL